MSTPASVSKGCFLHKRKAKQTQLSDLDCFVKEGDEYNNAQLRLETYRMLWKQVEKRVEDLLVTKTTQILGDVTQYLSNLPQPSNGVNQIPCAVLLTGTNMQDHAALYDSLSKSLMDKGVTHHIARVKPETCTSVRSLIEQVISKFMGCGVEGSKDVDNEDEIFQLKRYQCIMPILCQWYLNGSNNVFVKLPTQKFPTVRIKPLDCVSPSKNSNFVLLSPRKRTFLPKNMPSSPNVSVLSSKRVLFSPEKPLLSPKKMLFSPKKPLASPKKVFSPKKLPASPRKVLSPKQPTASPRKLFSPKKPIALPSKIFSPKKPVLPSRMPLFSSRETLRSLGEKVALLTKTDQFAPVSLTPCRIVTPSLKFALKPLIVVFEGFEGFPQDVIRDFILICSNYASSLPFAFVFGVATMPETFHRALPGHVASRLLSRMFRVDLSTDLLNAVIDTTLSGIFPFKLGGTVFRHLLDLFLFNDLSVQNYLQNLKLCMFEHFYSNSASVLCCNIEDIPARVKMLTKKDITLINELPSVKKKFRSADDISATVLQVHTNIMEFTAVVRILYAVLENLPNEPLGKQFRGVYSEVLNCQVSKSKKYKEAMQLLRVLSREELERRLKAAVDTLRGVLNNVYTCLLKRSKLYKCQTELKAFLEKFTTLDEQEAVVTQMIDKEKNKLDFSGQRLTRHQLQDKLLDLSKKSRQLNPYQKLRNEIVDWLDSIFVEYLDTLPSSIPLSEAVFFSNLSDIKQNLTGKPRAALHMALTNPHRYLHCKCCKLSEPNAILNTMPDVCILYKLYLECGRLINVYDWMQSFLSYVSPCDTTEQRDVSPELQARFIDASTTLQLLGFTKKSQRKTDHVARLTWGNC